MSTNLSTPSAPLDPNPNFPDPVLVPGTNTVLDDLVEAVNTYPKTYLTVEIFAVNPPGGAVNVGEDITFRVRVRNDGPLNVNDLTVLIEALDGANGVKLHGGTQFVPSITSEVFPQLRGHQADDEWIEPPDGHFHFEAGGLSTLADLVKVSINDHNLDWDHLLLGHSDPRPNANDIYSDEVVAS